MTYRCQRFELLLLLFFAVAGIAATSAAPRVLLEGSVEILAADTFGEDGECDEFALLHTTLGGAEETALLTFPGNRVPEGLSSGDWVRAEVESERIKVRATQSEWPSERLHTTLGEHAVERITFSKPSLSSVENTASAASASSQHRRTVVLIGAFTDLAVADCDAQRMASLMWDGDAAFNRTSVYAVYRDYSHGTVDFLRDSRGVGGADVFGPFSIAVDVTKGCAAYEWASAIETAAEASNVDLSLYTHRVLVIPATELCSWEGLGNVGCGLFCRVWIPRCTKMQTIIHELGHNLGLRHSASRLNEGDDYIEYGDPTSVMGNKWWGSDAPMDFVAPHVLQLGWLDASKVLSVGTSGIFEVGPLNQRPESTSLPQMARITHPDTGKGYFFSFRTGDVLPLTYRMLVHVYRGSSYACEFAESYTPDSYVAFKDANDRFSVRPLAITNTSMTFKVVYGCHKSTPTIELEYSSTAGNATGLIPEGGSAFVRPEVMENFTATITNTDSPLCRPLFFVISVNSSSSAVQLSLDTPTLALWPGLVCPIVVSVLSPVPETFSVTITAQAENSATATFSFVVVATESCMPSAPGIELAVEGSELFPLIGANASSVTLRITNWDSLDCDADTTISISTTLFGCPSGVVSGTNATNVQIAPRESTEVAVHVLALSYLSDSYAGSSCMLEVIAARNGDLIASLEIPVNIFKPCQSGALLNMTLFDLSESLDARSSYYVPLIVYDPRRHLCNYTLSISGGSAAATVVPIDAFVYLQNGVGSTRLLFTSRDSAATKTGTLTVSAQSTSRTLEVSTTKASCERNNVYFYLWCNTVTKAPPGEQGTIGCDIYLVNMDSWSCGPTTFELAPLNSTSPEFKGVFDYETIELFPSNYSWSRLTVVQEENGTLTGGFPFVVTVFSATGLSVHNRFFSFTSYFGRCEMANPDLEVLSDDFLDAHLRQTVTYRLRGWNRDNGYCSTTDYKIVLDPYPEGASVSISPSTATFSMTSYRDITITVTPQDPENDVGFNFTVAIVNAANTSFASDPVTLDLSIDPDCVFNTPSLFVWPLNTSFAVGDPQNETLYGILTNSDIGTLCSPLTYTLSVSAPLGSSCTLDGTSFTLEANTSTKFSALASLRENAAPGSYELSFSTTASDGIVHSVGTKVYLTVLCPVPEAPFNIRTTQVTALFATRPHAELTWNACENDVDCCCPCTWDVYRDGELAGTTSSHAFADSKTLEEGVGYSYTIVTHDKNNASSPNDTCRNSVQITGGTADLTTFYILLFSVLFVVLVIIICATVVLVYWHWPKLGPALSRCWSRSRDFLSRSSSSQTQAIQLSSVDNGTESNSEVVEVEPLTTSGTPTI